MYFKFLPFLLFITLIYSNLSAQNVKTKITKTQHSVHATTTNIDSFDTKGRLVKSITCWDKECKKQTINEYTYNENGDLTDEVLVEKSPNSTILLYHHVYDCFQSDMLTANNETTAECINKFDFQIVRHYNKNNQLIRITKATNFSVDSLNFPFYNPFGTINNLILESAHLKNATNDFCKMDYEFDSNNNLILLRYNYYKNEKITARSTEYYKYDNRNRLIAKSIAEEKKSGLLTDIKRYNYVWEDDLLIASSSGPLSCPTMYEMDYSYNKQKQLTKIQEQITTETGNTISNIIFEYKFY